MNNNTNEEKLRILQERLTQIKQKEEAVFTTPQNQEKEEIQITSDNIDANKKEKKIMSFKWLRYIAIIVVLGCAIFYSYNNINSLKLETSSAKIDSENEAETPIRYSKDLTDNNIATIASFEDEGSAKALVNDLKLKGFKCSYFYLPNQSNSIEEVYMVFIGPYENIEETNQWGENLKADFDIIQL
jgi:hypothetical protein